MVRLVYTRGLTLPETLAALVAFGIVVLSVATVHLERARAAPGIALREEAQRLGRELAEKIRSTQVTALASMQANQVHYEDTVGVVCNRDVLPKQPQAVADNDVACWQEKVRERLPNGEGSITSDASAVEAAYVVTVSWSQPGARGASHVLRVAKVRDVAGVKDVGVAHAAN
jgi:type IV pilus modification protein PilV